MNKLNKLSTDVTHINVTFLNEQPTRVLVIRKLA